MAFNIYELGNTIRLKVTFTNDAGVPVDPTAVVLRIIPPDQVEQTKHYPTPTDITRLSTGIYIYDLVDNEVGNYFYRFEGSGDWSSAADGQFKVRSSSVIPGA